MTRMQEESLRTRSGVRREHETGGILVGKRLANNLLVVLAATGPGPQADEREFEFQADAEHVNRELRAWHERDPHADFLGHWHKHPSSLDKPSRGDLESWRRNFDDPAFKTDELLCPIVVVDGEGQVRVRWFWFHRGARDREWPLDEVSVEVVEDDDPHTREHGLPLIAPAHADALWIEQLRALKQLAPRMKVVEVDDRELLVTIPLARPVGLIVQLHLRLDERDPSPTVMLEGAREAVFGPEELSWWSPPQHTLLDLVGAVIGEGASRASPAAKEPELPHRQPDQSTSAPEQTVRWWIVALLLLALGLAWRTYWGSR